MSAERIKLYITAANGFLFVVGFGLMFAAAPGHPGQHLGTLGMLVVAFACHGGLIAINLLVALACAMTRNGKNGRPLHTALMKHFLLSAGVMLIIAFPLCIGVPELYLRLMWRGS